MKLLNDELIKALPPLYSTEKIKDPIVLCKFFTPDSSWSWYVLEFDKTNGIFFGYVCGGSALISSSFKSFIFYHFF
jgi:hypothetical protein